MKEKIREIIWFDYDSISIQDKDIKNYHFNLQELYETSNIELTEETLEFGEEVIQELIQTIKQLNICMN